MRRICVVYLARAVNGVAPFKQFFQSYRRFPAGVEHDLAIVLKGFRGQPELEPYNNLIADLGAKSLRVGDYGFDIRAHLKAAREFENPYFCLFNSFSEILVEGWLEKLSSALALPGIGLVGTTASCESMYTNVLIEQSQSCHPTLFRRL